MRVITLDTNKKVISVKNVGDNYILQTNDIVSDMGEVGQIQQEDGSFINDTTPPLPQPKSETDILKEQLAQLNNDFMDFQNFYFQANPTQA